jgi:hypothetical protein
VGAVSSFPAFIERQRPKPVAALEVAMMDPFVLVFLGIVAAIAIAYLFA